jgi:hypothetical protein
MAHLLTPTLEVRTSREFLANQPAASSSTIISAWMVWLANFDYSGFWAGYDTCYQENTLGATATGSGGSGATASQRWSVPAGHYQLHYHIEAKVDTSVSNTSDNWTKEFNTQFPTSGQYFTGIEKYMSISSSLVNSSTKQKNVQFCSSRSNTSAIESNRAYVTFDHHLDWDHGGGNIPYDVYPSIFF